MTSGKVSLERLARIGIFSIPPRARRGRFGRAACSLELIRKINCGKMLKLPGMGAWGSLSQHKRSMGGAVSASS